MSANIPAVTRPRLAALIRLLGSDQDGEALGAARAMARVLGGAGSGFHDLAELIESDPSADSLQGRARSPFHASQWYPKGHPDQEWSYTPPPPPHRPAAFFVGGGWKYANQKTGPQAIADFLTIGGISVSPADIEFLRWVERRLWSEPHKSLDAIDLRRLGKIWKSNADLIEADASADRAAA